MENFLCQECGKCFLTNKKRLLHSKVHDSEEYECSICAKRVVGKQALENHKVSHDKFERHEKTHKNLTKVGIYKRKKNLKSKLPNQPEIKENPTQFMVC